MNQSFGVAVALLREAAPPPNLTGDDDGGAVGPDAGPVQCTAVSLGTQHRRRGQRRGCKPSEVREGDPVPW
jgi:hypothetical protein